MRTLDVPTGQPFALIKKVFDRFDRVHGQCGKVVHCCTCYPASNYLTRSWDTSRKFHRIRGACYVDADFFELVECRRFRTLTFVEEDLEESQRILYEWAAMVQEELEKS